ncbi:MAG: galactokinase [Nitrososphaerota archaeon]|nr:galactokinase [Nitrososphaerota archaeon]
MIITRTPFRLTLGGGGTDLPSYYSKYGGYVVTTAVNKHMYIVVQRMFEDKIRVSYSRTEIVGSRDEIQHPFVREALAFLKLSKNLEIVSVADVPARTGLGSSGSFGVGLLHALHIWKDDPIYPKKMAEETCRIQMEILKEDEGKQDPYIAAVGGIIAMDIEKSGKVGVTKIGLGQDALHELQNSLLFFYTGLKRDSSYVLKEQQRSIGRDEAKVVESMHRIKEIGHEVRKALEKGDVEEFGRLQHEHWLAKRNVSSTVTSAQIDRWYRLGLENGAVGGKLIGAGGGGFLMFCCANGRDRLRKCMAAEGLKEIPFGIATEGTKAIVNF